MPIVNDETKVCPDLTEWRKYCKSPDLDKVPLDWTPARADAYKVRADGKFVMVWLPTGIFEQLHFLMGFEDTLMNFIAEPEAMHELIEYIKEFKLQQIKKDTDYSLTLMGGIEASVVDREDWTEEMVRAEVARACKEYHDGGMFIPCLTYGGEGSIYPGVNDCIMDEVRKQNRIYFR